MSFQAQPTEAGTYRVKVYDTDRNRYWEYMPDIHRWIRLSTVDESMVQFQWNISPVAGYPDAFTIRPAYDTNVGLVSSTNNREKYWGYGFAQGQVGSSGNWKITKSVDGRYSKIKYENGYVLDCRDGYHSCVHFYQDQSANNQRFVFQLIGRDGGGGSGSDGGVPALPP